MNPTTSIQYQYNTNTINENKEWSTINDYKLTINGLSMKYQYNQSFQCKHHEIPITSNT